MAQLDPNAVVSANEQFWKSHPEINRRQLTLEPSDAQYRKEWMHLYRQACMSQPTPTPPAATPQPASPPPPVIVAQPAACPDVATMTHEEKIAEAIRRAPLADDVRRQLGDPLALVAQMVIIGGTLAGIAATGYGAIAEGIGAGLLIIGAAASGYQIGSGLMKLYEFWGQTRCDTARDSNDLDHAGQTFASGLGETGVGGLQLGLSLLGAKAMETPSLKTTPMLEAYQGEDQLGNPIWNGRVVNYLGDAERQFYKIEIRDGLLYDSEGKLFDTTSASTAHSGDGKAIYIMDQEGNLYASKAQVVGEFHHSSLAGGKPVAGAGEVEVHNGVLTSITDRSGHYQPPAEYTDQVIETLNSKGVDTDSVKVTKLGK